MKHATELPEEALALATAFDERTAHDVERARKKNDNAYSTAKRAIRKRARRRRNRNNNF